MSTNNPYGPYDGQPPNGEPSGSNGSSGSPPPPRTGGQPSGSGYAFGPFTPQAGPPPGPRRPGRPGQPARRAAPPPRRFTKRLAIIAVAVVVILAGGTGIVLASLGPGSVAPDPNTSTGAGTAPSSPAPTAPGGAIASDAVTGYLQALAAGDADTAIGYSAEPLKSGGTLSSAVLAASNKRAKITDIDVPAVTDANATTVQANYRLGRTPVTATFPVTVGANGWKLQQVVADVSLGTIASAGVPLRINGATVTSDSISLFPGSYTITSGLKTVTYGSHNTLVVPQPSVVADTSKIKLTATTEGKKVARSAARKAYQACLTQTATAPKGCPFGLTTGALKINTGSIKWTENGSDPFKKSSFVLTGRSIGVRVKLDVTMKADCTKAGLPATCSGDVKASRTGYVQVTDPKSKVVWVAS